ncbi:MAG: hypothetical protein CYPHOPRED_001864 [Cyphobasidiales sp. Tagirdzhanova-0007]|nr:MAG: hypothetical protein CYPHOPRED_001864 [Cyphobasidiales sp. Tagirdzhanova-0007]
MSGIQLLSEGVGYGVIIGVGFGFCLVMAALTYIQNRYTDKNTQDAEGEIVPLVNSIAAALIYGHQNISLPRILFEVAWCFSATLLISSTTVFLYGMSAAMAYGMAGALQIFGFSFVAQRVKQNANGAHTFLEIVKERFGVVAHIIYSLFALANVLIVSGTILLAGVSAMSAMTGININAGFFVIPITLIIFVYLGGLRATFLADYIHTIVVFITVMYVTMSGFYGSRIGSPKGLWDLLKEAQAAAPVVGNVHGSYTTFRSTNGVIFFFAASTSGWGGIFCDQGYWQRAIASKPGTTTKAYILGGLAWFSIPLAYGTSLGLVARALVASPDFPLLNLPQIESGFISIAAAATILGRGGVGAIFLASYMSCTSGITSELIAASSLLTFDLYKAYMNPSATPERLIKVEKIFIGVFGIFIACWNCAMYYAGLNLTFFFYFQGIILAGAIFPVALIACWTRMSKTAAIVSPVCGICVSVPVWLALVKHFEGSLNVSALTNSYAVIAGGMSGSMTGLFMAIILSLVKPDAIGFEQTRTIKTYSNFETGQVSDQGKAEGGADEKFSVEGEVAPVPEAHHMSMSALYWGLGIISCIGLVYFLLVASNYDFTSSGFAGWCGVVSA